MEDESAPDEIRSAEAIARRSLAVFSVIGLAFGAERSTVLGWLSANDLWQDLAPSEVRFIDTPAPSPNQVINASWLQERLLMLLWALEKIEELPEPDQQCDIATLQNVMPPYSELTVQEFISRAKLRNEEKLVACADHILSLHWAAQNAKIKGQSPRERVDLEVIQERHHAINWVIGYDGLPWDEVTTDT